MSRISPTRRASQVVLEGKPWERIQATADEPTEWLRLPFDNAGTRLGPPLWLRWHGLAGGRYRLEVPDNDYWTPFDLRELDRYRVFDGLSGAQLRIRHATSSSLQANTGRSTFARGPGATSSR